MDYTYILSESFENDIETRLTERQRLTEDTVLSLVGDLEYFFSRHAGILNSLKTKVTPDNWNQFSQQVSAEFSRFIQERFKTEKDDGFKGMWGKLTGQSVNLGNSAQKVWNQMFNAVVKNPKKYPYVSAVMNARSTSGNYTMGKDLLMEMFEIYLNGNETRGGIATGASRTAHAS